MASVRWGRLLSERNSEHGSRRSFSGSLFFKAGFFRHSLLVIWELTQACDLVCRHCRASAVPDRCPEELGTTEGFKLLDEVKALGTPVVVLSGGDPLKRPDLTSLFGTGRTLDCVWLPSPRPRHELHRQLRDPSLLKGRCGRCEFRDIFGGSRSRAYALTGDIFAEDPACLYEPKT